MLGGATAIFVADVLTDSGEGWGNGPAKVAIVEPLQNVPEGLKETSIETGAATSCYRRLRAGVRYVIIADGPLYAVAGCSPSFELVGREHILDAMRDILKGSSPRLVGSVLRSSGPYAHGPGLPQVRVNLKSGDVKLSAITDGEGRYRFTGLEPDKYQVEVDKAGYVPDDEFNRRGTDRTAANSEIEIRANSCEIRNLAMWPAGSIQGLVHGLDGSPIEGISVQVFGFDEEGRRGESPLRTSVSDTEGRYTLQPLASGQYVVGVNADLHQDENPYPPTLFADGRAIHLSESASIQRINIALPTPRTPALLRVRVLGPDGKPQKGAAVQLYSPAGMQRWISRERTGEDGELVAPAYVGQNYNLRAFRVYLANGKVDMAEASAVVDIRSREMSISVVLQAEQ